MACGSLLPAEIVERCFVRLERRRLEEARRSLDLIAAQWNESLSRLKLFVEAKAGDSGAR